VINLRGENKVLLEEKKRVKLLGMNFYNIAMSIYKYPDDEQVLKFLKIVLNPQNQPVFVHCESGRDRTGAIIAMYRVVVCGWSIKEAYREAKRFGFWPYRGEAVLKKFIHQLKDKKIYFQKAKEFLNKYY
jgi:protein tyrosine/serine phosphatase